MDVMLPNLNCDKCHGLNPGGGFNYDHCAEPQNEFPKLSQPGAPPAPGGRGN